MLMSAMLTAEQTHRGGRGKEGRGWQLEARIAAFVLAFPNNAPVTLSPQVSRDARGATLVWFGLAGAAHLLQHLTSFILHHHPKLKANPLFFFLLSDSVILKSSV